MKFGLIGKKLNYSLSKIMHEANFKALKLADYTYDLIELDNAGEIEKTIQKYDGLNITIPYKISVMNSLDKVDNKAKEIGAVNTLVKINGQKVGFNTDSYGFKQYFVNKNFTKALIIGAGGASRAVYTSLLELGIDVTITNRTKQKALDITKQYLTPLQAEQAISDFDLLINATPVGIDGISMPIKVDNIKRNTYVIDLIYNPLKTPLIIECEKRGCKVANGVDMLIHQGAKAFELWTGKKADINAMKNAVVNEMVK